MYPAELIFKVVPQRYPFLMVDRILEHEFKKKAVCQKNVTFGEEVLTGHFPHKAIYPGVLMVEMGLQTTQVMLTDVEKVAQTLSQPPGTVSTEEPPQGFLLAIEKFKFFKVIEPGDILRITSELELEAFGMMKARISLENDKNEKVATGVVSVGGAKA